MHPRNPFFNNPPDFQILAEKYPEFSKFVKHEATKTTNELKYSIDFKDPEALKVLCCVLLKDLFGSFLYYLINQNFEH